MYALEESRLRRGTLLALRIIFPILLATTLAFVFGNSAQVGEASSGRSSAVTDGINAVLGWLGMRVTVSELLVRKLAHVSEYMLVGFLLTFTLRVYTRRMAAFISWPILLGLLIALCDETLQLATPGRSGQITDVWIDFSGIALGIGVALVAIRIASAIYMHVVKRRSRKEETIMQGTPHKA